MRAILAEAGNDGPMDLSVVVPAFNERERIGPTVLAMADYLDDIGISHEILVVDDGSTDGTADQALGAVPRDLRVRVLRLPNNRGKGAAVREGMLAALGARRLFMDADLSTPPDQLAILWEALDAGADIAIGSRGLPDAELRVRQPSWREGMGRSFNVLVQSLVLDGISDTQCGFKLFRAGAAEHVFALSRLDGFAFDVEVLALARRARLLIHELPVVWAHRDRSKVAPIVDSWSMLADLLRIRRRLGRR